MKTEHQVEIDLDEVLDIEDDLEKRIFVKVSRRQISSPLKAKFISENSHRFKYFARNNQRKIQINKYLFTCNV